MKTCRKCLESKALTMFPVNRINLDGVHSYCKSCRSKLRKEHYRNNRLHVLADCKRYRDQHCERERLRQRSKYQRTKDRVSKKVRQYQLANVEKIRQWAVVNMSKRRARLVAGGTFTRGEWLALCQRYQNLCLCCGQRSRLSVDHVIPISRGGSNTIDNIQPLCGPCNSRKFTQTIDFRREVNYGHSR
jgi:5-methylcytosine-specific restriction endonuclease McrA